MSEAEIARIAAVAASVVKSMSGAGDSTAAGANPSAGA